MLRAVLAIGLLLVLPASTCGAENAGAAKSPPRVSLKLEQVPLREALKRLFQDAPGKHGVDSTVPDVPVSISLQDVSRETALRSLLRSAAAQVPGLTYEATGDYYQVVKRAVVPRPVTAVNSDPGAEKKVFLRLGGVNLREAYRRLVAGSLVRIHVHETVPDVPVELNTQGVSLPEAARAITRNAALLVPGLVIRPHGSGYVVFIDDNKPGLAGLPGMIALPGTDEQIAKIRVRYLEVSRESWLVQYLQYALLERQLNRQMNSTFPSDRSYRGPLPSTPNPPPAR